MALIPANILVKPFSIAIIGWEEGSAGQIDSWLHKASPYEVACFVNPVEDPPTIDIEAAMAKRVSRLFSYPKPASFKGRPLISAENWADVLIELGITKVLITSSTNIVRLQQIAYAKEKGLQLVSAIHPTALIMDGAFLHDNAIVHAKAVIGYRAEIHTGAIINIGAQLDHHDVVFSCASIAPGVVAAGNVTIGACAYIWTHASIINNIRVGAHSVVGAGAVIIANVPAGVTVVGVPGRVVKHSNAEAISTKTDAES